MTNTTSPKITATKRASMFVNKFTASAMLVGMLAASSAFAAGADTKPVGDQGRASTAYAQANAKMESGLAITYSGDADTDFVRWMIPHHQGAIDAAKVELQYGKDPHMLKMAQNILNQEQEINMMNAWLKQHGK